MKTAARLRLPGKARLRGRSQFTGTFSFRRQGKYFVVSCRAGAAGDPARLGMVVGRQAVPLSVTRSRMKRAIREVFRQMRPSLKPVDVVVRVRVGASRAEMPAARQELESLLRETS